MIIATLILLLPVGGSGAVPSEVWNSTFGENYTNEKAYSVEQTSDNGYIITGIKEFDAWLIKTNSNGIEQWNRTFGGIGYAQTNSVRQTSDGGYILVGMISPKRSGDIDLYNAWLIKTDSNGIEQWNKTFGGAGNDYAYSVQQTSDGGYIVAGMTNLWPGKNVGLLIKTDAKGDEVWNKTYESPSDGDGLREEINGVVQQANDIISSVRQTSDGGYILAGTSSLGLSIRKGRDDVWLIKTDSKGNEQWNKTFGGDSYDRGGSVQQTSDRGYIITGTTASYGAGISDAWLIKTDSKGNEQWNKTFGGAGNDYAYSVQQTSDGGYILAGENDSYGNTAWLIKTDTNGIEQWNKTFFGTDKAWSVQQTLDGGYVIAGEKSDKTGYSDAFLIKVSGDASSRYKSPGFEAMLGIFVIVVLVTVFFRK